MQQEDGPKKELIVEVFGRAASIYDRVGPRFFTHFGRRLADLAGLQSGDAVLDVATGRGAVLFAAAARVGPRGRVNGIDLSEAMVAETAREIVQRQLRHVNVRVMDAERLDFPEAEFDAVLCGFALFFFPNVERAMAEFHRVLRPGSRLAVMTWGEADSRWSWWDDLLKAYMTRVRLRTNALDKPGDVDVTMRSGGFARVQVLEETTEFVYADEEEWWATLWSHGGRASLERLSPDALERFKRDAFNRMRAQRAPNGYHEDFRVLYGLGRKES